MQRTFRAWCGTRRSRGRDRGRTAFSRRQRSRASSAISAVSSSVLDDFDRRWWLEQVSDEEIAGLRCSCSAIGLTGRTSVASAGGYSGGS